MDNTTVKDLLIFIFTCLYKVRMVKLVFHKLISAFTITLAVQLLAASTDGVLEAITRP